MSIRVGVLVVVVFGCTAAHSGTAALHRPLPIGSLEQNGTPQPLRQSREPLAVVRRGPSMAPALTYADAALKRPYGGTPIDVLTYHFDLLRTGWNERETDLKPSNVASRNFGRLTTLDIDGNVLAQPLLVSNFTMPDGNAHDVLVIATGHNSLYAFDAQNYSPLWRVNFGPSQSTGDVGCTDIQPEYGITSTPTIVRSRSNSATIYVVAATEPASFSFHTQLHAIDLGTGNDVVAPVEIDPKAKLANGKTIAFDPQNQMNRASLIYNNGNLYVGIGSHCDDNADAISGWLLDYDAADLKLLHKFHTISTSEPEYELASIWGGGFGPAIDTDGRIFAATGNGYVSKRSGDWAQSVLRLPADLENVQDYFTVSNYDKLNGDDRDLGSGGVMLLPVIQGQKAPPLAVAMGKDAVLYLLDRTSLGGLNQNDSGTLQHQRLAKSGMGLWGGPAYYGGPQGGIVYVQTDADVLRGFSVSVGSDPALTETVDGTSIAGFGGSLPIVSSNGSMPKTGIVWLIRRGTTIQLEAYDALALGNPLFQVNAGKWSNDHGNSILTPLEANGRVYVPAYKTVAVFGLGK